MKCLGGFFYRCLEIIEAKKKLMYIIPEKKHQTISDAILQFITFQSKFNACKRDRE